MEDRFRHDSAVLDIGEDLDPVTVVVGDQARGGSNLPGFRVQPEPFEQLVMWVLP
jgi:hypothetical protein